MDKERNQRLQELKEKGWWNWTLDDSKSISDSPRGTSGGREKALRELVDKLKVVHAGKEPSK